MMNAEQGVCAWAMNHPLEREYHDKEWAELCMMIPSYSSFSP